MSDKDSIHHIFELKSINHIHDTNYNLLMNHLIGVSNLKHSLPGSLISTSFVAKVEFWDFVNQLQTYMFNYLSSAKSLIDFSRKHYKNNYDSNDVISDYQKRTDLFSNSILHIFMQKLRNYIIHYQLPPLTKSKSIDSDDVTTHRIIIDNETLINSGFDWGNSSRIFLTESVWAKNRDVTELFVDYYSSLKEFQDWYETTQKKIFENEIQKIEKENQEYHEKIAQGIINHIKSKKGFTSKQIDENLLRCFLIPEASEILKIPSEKNRIVYMLDKLTLRKIISYQDAALLSISIL